MKLRFLLAFAAIVIFAGSAHAVPVAYSVQGDGNDQLYTIDLGAGTTTAIGATGFGDIEGLSFQPGSGTLFGWDDSSNALVTINIVTGAATSVGASGITTLDVGLAFTDNGGLFLADEAGGNFYSVNSSTGAASLVGSTGSRDITALAALGNTLYGIDENSNALVTINTSNASTTLVGSLGISVGDTGIAFDGQGRLWGIEDDGRIFTINTTTGAATIQFAANSRTDDFEGLAIQSEIPEPASMLLFGLGLAGLGYRRRKA